MHLSQVLHPVQSAQVMSLTKIPEIRTNDLAVVWMRAKQLRLRHLAHNIKLILI